VNPYAGAVRALGRTRAFAWVMAALMPRLDRPFRRRRRSVTSLGTGFPLCYLTVRRRHGGEERTVPLLFLSDGERVVLIGSNWGKPQHPAWALDLEAAAVATVTVNGAPRRMRSRRATDAERSRYWPQALRVWPGYEGYRDRAGREIRMFVLEPAEAGRPQAPMAVAAPRGEGG
jgi:deazaflavin-dependent oxidoreductase (nitroreductase family)